MEFPRLAQCCAGRKAAPPNQWLNRGTSSPAEYLLVQTAWHAGRHSVQSGDSRVARARCWPWWCGAALVHADPRCGVPVRHARGWVEPIASLSSQAELGVGGLSCPGGPPSHAVAKGCALERPAVQPPRGIKAEGQSGLAILCRSIIRDEVGGRRRTVPHPQESWEVAQSTPLGQFHFYARWRRI